MSWLLIDLLARECGFHKVPRLLVTTAVTAPALTGLWKPIILLPPRSLEKLEDEALRFALLHELAHLRRRDLWTNWILAVLRSLHWFNPLVWWAFHRLRVEAERATDVWVLERSGAEATTCYGETLLNLLEMDCSRPARLPGVVGVLENSRDLRSRIVAIASFTGRRSRFAATSAALLLSGIAVVGLTQAPAGKAAPIAPLAATIAIRAVERATNAPLSGVIVTLVEKPAGTAEFSRKTSATNEKGEVTFMLAETLTTARIEVHKEGYTGHFANVRAGIPFTFRLDPIAIIGGKVVDQDGMPVAGAQVEVNWNSIQAEIPREKYQWSIDDPEAPILTATDGSWSYSLGPADFSLLNQNGKESREAPHAVRVTVSHPEYSRVELRDGPQDWRRLLLGRTAAIVMISDFRITGRILDAKGNPISNAMIRELVKTGVNSKETRSQRKTLPYLRMRSRPPQKGSMTSATFLSTGFVFLHSMYR